MKNKSHSKEMVIAHKELQYNKTKLHTKHDVLNAYIADSGIQVYQVE